MATFYLGEHDGARVLAYGDAVTQVGDDFQMALETWDVAPAGEVGDVLFRAIDVSGTSSNGYSIGITPIVDGIAQPEQTFNSVESGKFQAQAFFAKRGTRCAARVRTLSRTGDVELNNVQYEHVVIRENP